MKESKTKCSDLKCPHHGNIIPRGRTFRGTVVSSKAQKTAIIQWERRRYVPKYERYEILRSKVAAHNPPCINAKKGEVVDIKECRKLSKTKSFVITQKVGEDIEFLERESEKEEKEEKEEKKKSEKEIKEK